MESSDGPESNFNELELRPYLEGVIDPTSSVVGYGVIGFSYLLRSTVTKRTQSSDGGSGDSNAIDTSSYGLGPVFGVGLHAFPGKRMSFDFSLTVRHLFRHDPDLENQLEENDLAEASLRETSMMLQMGASFWP